MGGSGRKEWWNSLPLPLLSCKSWILVKENPDKNKQTNKQTNKLIFKNWQIGLGKVLFCWIAVDKVLDNRITIGQSIFLTVRFCNEFCDGRVDFAVRWLVPIWWYPAGTATLSQLCHNVVVDVVTTLWHGRKLELWRRRSPTLWQRCCPTLSRRFHNAATTLPQH